MSTPHDQQDNLSDNTNNSNIPHHASVTSSGNKRISAQLRPAPITVPHSPYGSVQVNEGSHIRNVNDNNELHLPNLIENNDHSQLSRKTSQGQGDLGSSAIRAPFKPSHINPDEYPDPYASSRPGTELGGATSARTPKSLTRPERIMSVRSNRFRENLLQETSDKSKVTPWRVFSWTVTCCCPAFILDRCGKRGREVQQAWREKVALCMIIAVLCAALGYLTFLFDRTTCNRNEKVFSPASFQKNANLVRIREGVYDISKIVATHQSMPTFAGRGGFDMALQSSPGRDASPFFKIPMTNTCQSLLQKPFIINCESKDFPGINKCHDWNSIQESLTPMFVGPVVMPWSEIQKDSKTQFMVLNGHVLNMEPYFTENPEAFGPIIHNMIIASLGSDGTAMFAKHSDSLQAAFCLASLYSVARLETQSLGCFASEIVLYISLIIISVLIIVRFVLAVAFKWFMSTRLGRLKDEHKKRTSGQRKQALAKGNVPFPMEINGELNLGSQVIAKSKSQFGQNLSIMPHGSQITNLDLENGNGSSRSMRPVPRNPTVTPVVNHSDYGQELYTLMLVTCYSEDEAGLRTTFDSLASTTYSEDYKLMFIVADGLIKGKGKSKSTPDMIIEMLELDPNWPEPEPLVYFAIGEGSREKNLAKVYVGWYNYKEASVPTILIVKCGSVSEANTQKPGNRGKRDSQMILMRFLQHVTFDQPMSAMEFDLFQKIHYIMGVTPDQFEIVLMVDADTKVAPDSLARMVACMADDPQIMGLCGETRIANKTESYITRIQVFEYYLSHHMTKAFESIFGNVTCLPGCFCMYRIKAPKDGYWVPILCNPQIVTTYAQNVVDTLHKKNLLLLGEDRFLTTLMLRVFPNRKLIFVPRAYCKTTVPNSFSVLLSQRRRWINSTIHNLLELLLVRELCGAFCFSMQFVIFLEIIGTVTLPAAIIFTTLLIIFSFLGPVQVAPLALLGAILGLPAVLILLTLRRLIYVYWLLVYLTALPIWNFVLPVYAFWHFDDFSWGQTRKVEGEGKDKTGHGGGNGADDAGNCSIEFKRWAEWERDRRNDLISNTVHGLKDKTRHGMMNYDKPTMVE